MNETLFYRCEICGNIVALINSGGGELTCCGQAMTNLQANSTDVAKEKHVPVLTNENGKITVNVGSVAHPMTTDHYIEWIALISGTRMEIIKLTPGMEPKTDFAYVTSEDKVTYVGDEDELVPNCEGNPCNFVYNNQSTKATVYAYCNLHGLWKAEIND
jgi:superoxide reductase